MSHTDPDTRTRAGDRSVFVILLALYGVVLYPILRADRYYNDDLKRALIGRTGWDSNGRPLTTLLMKLLQCYDHALVDISPFTQLAAIAMLAGIGVLIARRYAIRSPWLAALVAFPLGAQPFYMENLSYKFDALSMSFAMLFALVPVLVLGQGRRAGWLGVLALFVSLNFYQPAINVYLMFVLLEFAMAQLRDQAPRDLWKQLAVRAGQFLVSMAIYEIIVGIHVNGWVKRKSVTIHHLSDLPQVGRNALEFARHILHAFNTQWWLYFGPALLALAVIAVAAALGYARRQRALRSTRMNAALVAAALLLPVAALLCVPGPMLVLLDPLLAPRVLIGVGALLSAALILMQGALRCWCFSERWTIALSSLFALGMCVFASAYGNALGEQKCYEDRIATRLADDLAALPTRAVLLDGSPGMAPITRHIGEQFPLMRELVPSYIGGSDLFHTHIFLLYYIEDFDDIRLNTDAAAQHRNAALIERSCSATPVSTTSHYTLYVLDDVAVVRMGAQEQRCGNDTAAPLAQPSGGIK
ncbi:MAG: glucosyltransferase domain-containing protein [Rhodanobacter sp.]|jgi:hypothetical protein|nr:glucosyltransferase domain-containing protein [Rhodanobacter sp.]